MSLPLALPGGCLRGAVRFEVRTPTKCCAYCHCTLCRRAHGAAFVTWVGADSDRLRIPDAGQLAWYASSPGAERGFCRRCGSTLFFRSARWPGELHVTRANFDGPIDREPSVHAYWDTHVSRVDPGDSLPRKPG